MKRVAGKGVNWELLNCLRGRAGVNWVLRSEEPGGQSFIRVEYSKKRWVGGPGSPRIKLDPHYPDAKVMKTLIPILGRRIPFARMPCLVRECPNWSELEAKMS
jgi:hypothetical protein